ncbi:VOC family protein [Kineococcus esterisolvens]|uniref:VOC family protein n=1 Tax=unclassified Kineococcus TaxID=2621656 RepID=UPI003D7E112A
MNDPLPGTEALGALTVFVSDVDAEATFHRDVLGMPLAFADADSVVLMLGSTALNLLSIEAADELVAPAASSPVTPQVQALLTLWVDDVDAACAELARRGVALLNGPLDRPWGKRTAAFSSPGGLLWEIAQDL